MVIGQRPPFGACFIEDSKLVKNERFQREPLPCTVRGFGSKSRSKARDAGIKPIEFWPGALPDFQTGLPGWKEMAQERVHEDLEIGIHADARNRCFAGHIGSIDALSIKLAGNAQEAQ